MNRIIEDKMNKAWGLTQGASKQVKVSNGDYLKKLSHLTAGIHDSTNIRKYISEFEPLRLDDCITEIKDIVELMENEIKFTFIDVAIEELTIIKDSLIKYTSRNIFIKDIIAEGIRDLNIIKLGELSDEISEQIGLIPLKVDSSFTGVCENSNGIMTFYIYIDDKHCTSKSEYRQFNVSYKKNISVEEYVNLIVTNLDNKKVYSNRRIFKNVIKIKDFLDKHLVYGFHIFPIDGLIYHDNEEIFQIYEQCIVRISEDDLTITIEDEGYERIFIDLKNDSYSSEELM